ncbi:MAG TPA: DUF3592 domain-containing protein [Acidobacteriaceae bacterium]|nr:DUF3592 domain-containing protein [Acidobacteriaceae bacterium]
MTEFPETDLETLRRSRVARLEADLHELASRLTHLHWPSTEAEVTDCRQIRFGRFGRHYLSNSLGEVPDLLLSGYAVGFRYSVDGTSYGGTLNSLVEVEPGDRFEIRYNPQSPEENNSICSKNSPSSILSPIIGVLIAALILILFAKDRFFSH